MSVRTARNFKTARATAGASYTEVGIRPLSYFAIYVPTEGALLSIGHATADDATSVDVPGGTSFELEAGITGSIQIKSATGTPVVCSVVYA